MNIQVQHSSSLGKYLIVEFLVIKGDTSMAELNNHSYSKWIFVNADFTAVKQL